MFRGRKNLEKITFIRSNMKLFMKAYRDSTKDSPDALLKSHKLDSVQDVIDKARLQVPYSDKTSDIDIWLGLINCYRKYNRL